MRPHVSRSALPLPVQPTSDLLPTTADTRPLVALEGNLASMPLTDLVQMICLGSYSVKIEIVAGLDMEGQVDLVGCLWAENGTLIHCTTPTRSGEEAFFELMRRETGRFQVVKRDRAPIPTTITCSWQGLLLNAAQRKDEQGRILHHPTARRQYETREIAVDGLMKEAFEMLLTKAIAAFEQRQHERARALLRSCLALAPRDQRAYGYLKQLDELTSS